MNKIIILHFIAYILGSIPVGYLIGKFYGLDIRENGSGNTGATNVSRVIGKKQGYLTLLADMTKGVFAVFLAYLIPANTEVLTPESFAASLGLAAIIGHCYSPFLKFNGGKGVATSLGVFLALSPANALFAVFVFLSTVRIWNFVSIASLAAAASLPVTYLLASNSNGMTTTAAVIAACIVASRHKNNIYRISEGTEPKLFIGRLDFPEIKAKRS